MSVHRVALSEPMSFRVPRGLNPMKTKGGCNEILRLDDLEGGA